MNSVAHIINPVKVKEKSDLFFAQPITFETMIRAKNQSANSNHIQLITTQLDEDKSIIPAEFQILSNLEKSVLDVNPQLKNRKLPLIKDILEKIKEIEKPDFVIFTNMDIAVMPFFYDAVFEYLKKGHDALVINRRRIPAVYKSIDELPLMYAQLGKSHPGFDCFVIKTELLE